MKILFAIDGSPCSKEAIAAALNMRCPAGTELHVVTVVDFFEPLPALDDIKKREVDAARRLVDETVSAMKATHPNATVTGDVLDGYTTNEILRCCDEWPADLVMLGSHGRSSLSSFLLGSVSRSVLTHASCAVRVIRLRKHDKQKEEGMNVLIAVDESDHSRHMINHALLFPWAAGTRFKVLNVLPEIDENALFEPDNEFRKRVATHYEMILLERKAWLQEAVDRINNLFGSPVAESEVQIGDPRNAILESAKSWMADIIMVGSHGRQGMERLMLGSVSEAIATHAPCSVEVTRTPGKGKSATSMEKDIALANLTVDKP